MFINDIVDMYRVLIWMLTPLYHSLVIRDHVDTLLTISNSSRHPNCTAVMIELLIEDPRGNMITHQLGEGHHTLGKSPKSDVILMDPYVSRYHADLLVTRTGMFIIDMNSTNGIWSQGKRIKKILKINHGVVFSLGKLQLQTRIPRFKLYVREGRMPIKTPLLDEDDLLSPQEIDQALLLDVPEITA